MKSPIHQCREGSEDEELYNQQPPGANDTIGGYIRDKGEVSHEEMDEPHAIPETEPFKGRQGADDNSALGEEDYQNVELHGQIIDTDRGYENANSNW